MKRSGQYIALTVITSLLLACSACGINGKESSLDTSVSNQEKARGEVTEEPSTTETTETAKESNVEKQLVMRIGDTRLDVSWENNESVRDLEELSSPELKIPMSMYGGFEQVGSIGRSITRSDRQTTTKPGDIVLYSGDQLVVFYGSNSWSYTRLGKINLTQEELTDLLGKGDVTISLSMEQEA